jgi:hypothetical protein
MQANAEITEAAMTARGTQPVCRKKVWAVASSTNRASGAPEIVVATEARNSTAWRTRVHGHVMATMQVLV